MPDLKISAMTIGLEIGNADILPMVQGGANFSITKQLILEQATGEKLTFQSLGTGKIRYETTLDLNISCDAGKELSLSGSGGGMKIHGDGSMTLQPPVGKTLFMYYTPQVSANWMGDPGSVWEAIDRIAAVLGAGGATPIP